MKNAIKLGIGVTIGVAIGKLAVDVASRTLLHLLANNESYMDGLKDRDPDLYEKIKKHAD